MKRTDGHNPATVVEGPTLVASGSTSVRAEAWLWDTGPWDALGTSADVTVGVLAPNGYGLMFWLLSNTLSGSYLRLSSASCV